MAAYDRYPVRLRPVVLQKIWGGPALRERLGKADAAGKAGESWEVSDRPGYESVVADGPAAGLPLSRYLALMGEDFYGGAVPADGFPLLIKFIGPADWLSVQVHPGDDTAGEGEAGKAEAWMVVDAPEGGRLVYGARGGRDALKKALREGNVADCLGWLPVRPGDVVNIPAGTLHALGPGVLVYEIQQSSDTTFRVYDWDRVDGETGKPRQLHVERAMAVTRWDAAYEGTAGLTLAEAGGTRTVLISNPRFTLERVDADGCFTDRGPDGFSVWSVMNGAGRVVCGDGGRSFPVAAGDSFIVPACGMGLVFEGKATLLKGHTLPSGLMRRWLMQRGVPQEQLTAVDWR